MVVLHRVEQSRGNVVLRLVVDSHDSAQAYIRLQKLVSSKHMILTLHAVMSTSNAAIRLHPRRSSHTNIRRR